MQISLCHMERSGQLFVFSLIFIYLVVLSLSRGTQDLWSSLQHAGSFSCGRWTPSCGAWDLVPRSGIEPRFPALGVQSLSHWTTREVPGQVFIFICSCSLLTLTASLHADWLQGWDVTHVVSMSFTMVPVLRPEATLQNHCLIPSLPSSWTPSPI